MNRTSSVATDTISTPNMSNKTNSQFKHTILWNNIISDLKKNLIDETSTTRSARSASCSSTSTTNLNKQQQQPQAPTRIRRQHSRFLAAGVNGMLLLKQNLMNNHNNNTIENVCFSGSKCVDIVYDYLTSKEQSHNFERQITRDKVSKLCQMLMDSGVFESISKNNSKFDDTILKLYRFKQPKEELSPQKAEQILPEKAKTSKPYISDDEVFTNDDSNKENTINKNSATTTAFNKNDVSKVSCTKQSKSTSSNTKLKRKLISMRRSSTVQTLMPIETVIKQAESTSIDDKRNKEFVMKQIKRELIIEKLLTLIDLPVIENLLLIDQLSEASENESIKDLNQNLFSTKSNRSKSVSCLEPISSLSILNQTYDLTKCDNKEEWRKSAIECLQHLEWEKIWQQKQQEQDHFENELKTLQISKTNSIISKYSIVNALYNPITPHRPYKAPVTPKLQAINDTDLYNLLKEYYIKHYFDNRNHFLDDSFQPLFSQILLFLRQTHYNKALEALNLGTLLLLEKTQAEFKRLLKFLFLTANTSTAPRLSQSKPNNSILLNHFAGCLFNTRIIGFEESRLILNFMLNNFDDLFKINKSIEESLSKRFSMMKKYGHEEALLEKLYCKKMTNKEFNDSSKEETTKALVDLINHIVDDPQISLKQKKLKLRALQRIHPDIYEKHFSDLQY